MIIAKTPLLASCSYADPPSLDILRSAYVPSAPDTAVLLHDLASIDVSIASIDKEIAIIMERAADLRRVRTKLVKDRRTKRSLLSPLRRLPTEILELIIRASLPDKWLTHGSGRAVFPLAQTCHRLRAVTLAMSDLWCNISLFWKLYFEGAPAKFTSYADCLLARARERPIDLKIPEGLHKKPSDTVIDQWVVSHLARSRCIEWCPSSGFKIPLDAPLLESLRIMGNEDFYNSHFGIRYSAPTFSFDAPNLRRFALRWCGPIFRVAICWSRLQDLEIATISLDEPDMRILESCASLMTLGLNFSSKSASQKMEAAAPQLRFDNLRSLTVVDYGHAVCKYIRAPSLVSLTLKTGDHVKARPDIHASHVLDMLRGSSPPVLETLVINACGRHIDRTNTIPNYASYLSILACNPALNRLELVYHHSNRTHDLEPVLQGLILQPNATALLPNLDHLVLTLGGFTAFTDHDAVLLSQIIQSRWDAACAGGARPIMRLTLHASASDSHRARGFCSCATKGDWQKQLEALGTVVDRTSCIN
ncbi:hypothetical protein FB107DRAFT_264714 [Schizophyllum commune]